MWALAFEVNAVKEREVQAGHSVVKSSEVINNSVVIYKSISINIKRGRSKSSNNLKKPKKELSNND